MIDCFARVIVRPVPYAPIWCLDALEQAIWSRHHHGLGKLVHHSDRGVQYVSIRDTERVAGAGGVSSVGSSGGSYDNALAESVIGLYKTELVRNKGPWRGLDDVEIATLEWVDGCNHRRLLEPIGHIPPPEAEAAHTGKRNLWQKPRPKKPSLYETRGGSRHASLGTCSIHTETAMNGTALECMLTGDRGSGGGGASPVRGITKKGSPSEIEGIGLQLLR
jgi:hypothetical protein